MSTGDYTGVEREFDMLMAKAGANVPADRKAGVVAGYKDMKAMAKLLRQPRTKKWMRTLYALRSVWQLKRSSLDETGERDYWQAGKSVATIHSIEPAGSIVQRFAAAIRGGS